MKVYRRKSIRLQGFDYSRPGCYFITLCTKNLECLFGEIIRGEMIASPGGQKVIECWQLIPQHYPIVKLYSFILRPNHVHGILEIMESAPVKVTEVKSIEPFEIGKTRVQVVEPLPSQFQRKNRYQHIIPQSLGCIVRGFEIGVTKWYRENTNVQTVWQGNFYDKIIRTDKSFHAITKYIINNPKNWNRDQFYDRNKPH